ncbi:MAG: sialate O-acetylesterase [Isosphaeraceae bacterium]
MSRSHCLASRLAFVMVAAFGMASIDSPVLAQFGGQRGAGPGSQLPSSALKEPLASRVYQRDANGRAEIPIVPDGAWSGSKVVDASLNGQNMAVMGIKYVEGKLVGVPTGGPYMINVRVAQEGRDFSRIIGPVFVGDLWVLAGQSNMEGVGDLVDMTPPHQSVMMLGMNGKWSQAEEPLHWLVDSPDPVHSGDAKTRADRSAQTHKSRKKGAGLGLPFAAALASSTGVPIGLVACAHGGTSMEQWNPAKKDQGGNSLYGSMLRQFNLAGGKVKGVLWYQGESDAMGGDAWKSYSQVFARFIASVRSDFGQPELPFYFVQIGRFVRAGDSRGWNTVQDAQRLLPERVPNTAVISVIDLELDDAIHVGTQGLKRAGHRLARIAERELFGQVGATTPTFDRVTKGAPNALVVKFKGVNMGTPGPYRGRPMMGTMGSMGGMAPTGNPVTPFSLGESAGIGLKPERHIAGFSIRKEDGSEIPMVFEAGIGKARDTVVLKLTGAIPPKSALWYGYGMDPYCNLVDGMDMAIPVFGPIPLDEIGGAEPATPVAAAPARPQNGPQAKNLSGGQISNGSGASNRNSGPIHALVITGDNVGAHKWKETSQALKEILEKGGRIKVDITTTPAKDLNPGNLAKYDVFILNYWNSPNGPPETRWSDDNKDAFLKAVYDGKGLVSYHFGSAAFARPNWVEFEKAVAGGWRTQGFHGPAHVFSVKKTNAKHPISEGLPAQFEHPTDELYQNSMLTPESQVLATAYSDSAKPKGTGKDEPVIWVNHYGKGRVYENVLGHDTGAMADPNYQQWLRRGVIWAATGKPE